MTHNSTLLETHQPAFGLAKARTVAVIYHSVHGHTKHIAREVCHGARSVPDIRVQLLKAGALAETPDELLAYDGFILVSPTYLGGVSAPFKSFMDATGRLWRTQQLKGRLAAGFTVSSLPGRQAIHPDRDVRLLHAARLAPER